MEFPKIKKKINDFLIGEQGNITKDKLIKAGGIITIITSGLATADVQTETSHDLKLEKNSDQSITGTHTSHLNDIPHNHPIHNNGDDGMG